MSADAFIPFLNCCYCGANFETEDHTILDCRQKLWERLLVAQTKLKAISEDFREQDDDDTR